ncbi:hypothetical protein Clacol_004365 [Clathrus columnatus]|uniref:Macrofage activating glycoprotein n=1 Tax=Clathrus columnatus TaxID=1419009 RepID=A0AAV5A691_9AGAM|nr:hypothetical protein Clacol_004365 [Clathrus columnatus]
MLYFVFLSSLTLALWNVQLVITQDIPLADKQIPYDQIPEKVDTDDGPRGIQIGYNRCNSTTEGQSSLCQTAYVNSLDDFCIWGPREPNSTIAEEEGALVAWCTQPGRGTRIIPPNTLQGIQFMRTPDYLQITGRIDQSLINIASNDTGGEEDPHGADGRGNPLGSLVYSNGFASNNGNTNNFQQVIEWHNFLGGNIFCFKICDPAGANAVNFCQHIYDRIGCAYNAPAAYRLGVFEKCLGDNQDFPGVYTGPDGQVSTYFQPPESLGPITSIPYQPRIPASSQCVQFQSEVLYSSADNFFPKPTSTSTSSTATATTSVANPIAIPTSLVNGCTSPAYSLQMFFIIFAIVSGAFLAM